MQPGAGGGTLYLAGRNDEAFEIMAPAVERAERVLARVREMRGGRLNDPRFGHRLRGEGAYAAMVGARFARACRRLGLNQEAAPKLDVLQFERDPGAPRQGGLFD